MIQVRDGQCGMCVHFGEDNDSERPKLLQIRATHQAPEDLVERCGLPGHAQYDLRVTPASGCAGFAPAIEEQLHVSPQEA